MRLFTLVVAGLSLAAFMTIAADSAGPLDRFREHPTYMPTGIRAWFADNVLFKSEDR